MDNTWATPLYFRAFDKGVDLVDPGRHQIYRRPFRCDARHRVGQRDDLAAAPATRCSDGAVRRAPTTSISACAACARWGCGSRITTRPGCRSRAGSSSGPRSLRVLHPALESHPGHAIWKRDFSGARGLFSIVLKPVTETAVNAFLDALTLFGMGASWGGYESLVIPFDCTRVRTATAVGAGRADAAFPYRPRGRRRPDRRSRARLRGARCGAVTSADSEVRIISRRVRLRTSESKEH